ncbi:expressed unknown protein [Seminavis robusta]|uniref:Uncharacterized protein n=1 Tax=Seminavis robusta TaxID=568900 RepID=A0A9N8HNC3_9STRA|nr:expressed unknown protein [Seminavis robusta]|eukprot:Sro981_g227540.1 n/a (172) ;mRNA; f:23976-24491
MSPINNNKSNMRPDGSRKRLPKRTRSLDKTNHYRTKIIDEEDLYVVMVPAAAPRPKKKSVRFSDTVAIDVATGKEYVKSPRTGFSFLADKLSSRHNETCFWKRDTNTKTRKITAMDDDFDYIGWADDIINNKNNNNKSSSKPKRKLGKKSILRGWSKLHHKILPFTPVAAC